MKLINECTQDFHNMECLTLLTYRDIIVTLENTLQVKPFTKVRLSLGQKSKTRQDVEKRKTKEVVCFKSNIDSRQPPGKKTCPGAGDPDDGTAQEGVRLGTLNAQCLLVPISSNRTSLGPRALESLSHSLCPLTGTSHS